MTQKLSTAHTLLLVVVALFLLPKYGATHFNGTIKCFCLSFVTLGFIAFHCFRNKQKINRSIIDVLWLSLIGLTGLLIPTATNTNFALYGFFTTSLLYLCYTVFSTVNWQKGASELIYPIALVGTMTLMSIQAYNLRNNFFTNTWVIGDATFLAQFGEINHHWLGAAMMMLLPFLLFQKGGIKVIIAGGSILFALFLASIAGSAQVLLVGLFLGITFILFHVKMPVKNWLYLGLGLLFIVGGGLLMTFWTKGDVRGFSFVIDEFFDQSDRIWMWQQSWELFKEAPLTGIGKNNWEIAVGKWGYEACYYCSQSEFIVNRFKHGHNAIFQIISEHGLFGLVLYGSIGFVALNRFIKKWSNIQPIELAALTSLLSFFFLCLTYGIVYNYFNHFQGLPVLAVCCLAIIQSPAKPEKISFLSTSSFTIISFILSLSCLLYFYQFASSQKHFKLGADSLHSEYNVGQIENHLLKATTLSHPTKGMEKLAHLYEKMGYPEMASLAYKKALLADPYNVMLGHDYASFLYKIGDYTETISISAQVNKLTKEFLPNDYLWTRSNFKIGNLAVATQSAKQLKSTLEEALEATKYYDDTPVNRETRRKRTFYLAAINDLLNQPPDSSLTTTIQPSANTYWLSIDQLADVPKLLQHTTVQIDEIQGHTLSENNSSITVNSQKDLWIRGWAIDTYDQTTAGAIFLEIGDTMYRANYGLKREDVAKAHNNPAYAKSGFHCHIPKGTFPTGKQVLKIWVAKKSKRAVYQPTKEQQITLKIKKGGV